MVDKPTAESTQASESATSEEEGGDQPLAEQSSTAELGPARSSKGNEEDVGRDLGSNPVLKKIGRLLTNSTGKDWKQGGFEVNSGNTVPRPIQVHEFVYVRDLGDKSIIVKASTPVSCQYAPGGYKLMPASSGYFSIELRDRVFDPDKLVDPKFASNFKGKFLEVLATGEVARKLFEDVGALVKGSSQNLQRVFEDKAKFLIETLLDKVENSEIQGWARSTAMVEGRDNTTYETTHDGLALTVLRSVEGWDAYYELKIKQDKFEIKKSGSTPKLILAALEHQQQDSELESLEKKLRELGLEDD